MLVEDYDDNDDAEVEDDVVLMIMMKCCSKSPMYVWSLILLMKNYDENDDDDEVEDDVGDDDNDEMLPQVSNMWSLVLSTDIIGRKELHLLVFSLHDGVCVDSTSGQSKEHQSRVEAPGNNYQQNYQHHHYHLIAS